MSNESGASSGTSGVRRRGTVVGVPKRCWCGKIVVARMSKSEANPYRRYYRAYAVERKLSNDNHSYKWVDEALADEIEILGMRTERLEQQNQIANLELEKLRFEKEILEKVGGVVGEAKSELKKLMVIVALGCLSIVVCSRLIG
ncbi:uncharacterized protein At4g04775-like [Brassica napus]|uniref:GRF-type domain-containing protein n=1 Tax=Brassica oleracea var. oleracea TaxID=109376 RepID=A0A0D3DKN2_BRAOL|nr:PREDICTED: uncharacterized protein At4g04775-like [Brassica oleracea var. oleracea]XP_022564363.1 uncharacterized protein At4g04775-like [Brassica napus]